MSWQRQKSIVPEEPEEPSSSLWLMLGVVSLVGSVMLFITHANKLAGPLQQFNIWIIAATPLAAWFVFLCLRGWLYNEACDKYKFESDEAEYARQKWVDWAGRYLVNLYSRVILPEGLTAATFLQAPTNLEQYSSLTSRLILPAGEDVFSALLEGLDETLIQLGPDLTFAVTLLTDSSETESELLEVFVRSWRLVIGLKYPVPVLTVMKERSFLTVEERLKSPSQDVELLLVHQMHGRETYSDALVALLMTSDDVATKYQLSHRTRLLRPISFDPTQELHTVLDSFFSTQSQANTTNAIVGDAIAWGDTFAALLTSAKEHNGIWKPQQCHWLEKYAGLTGPFSPWIMAAVVSDIVTMTQTDCLMLSVDNDNRFMNTVTTGDLVNAEG